MIFNFFEKFFYDSFINFSNVTPVEFMDVIIVLFWSIVLSFLIALTYRGTHRGVSYSQSFTQTLVILGMIVAMIMVVIGSDIARAFTLVGALSIVRFRNALKETRDVGFIFFTMAVGMACGTRFYILSIIFTLVGCSLLYILTYSKFGQKSLSQDILELNFPVQEDYVKILSPIFTKHLKYYSMLGIDSVDEVYNRLSFIVTFKTKTVVVKREDLGAKIKEKLDPKSALLLAIQQIPYINNLKIIDGSSSVEI
jgi:hypothetical protein